VKGGRVLVLTAWLYAVVCFVTTDLRVAGVRQRSAGGF
jgi:hypothetical protein